MTDQAQDKDTPKSRDWLALGTLLLPFGAGVIWGLGGLMLGLGLWCVAACCCADLEAAIKGR